MFSESFGYSNGEIPEIEAFFSTCRDAGPDRIPSKPRSIEHDMEAGDIVVRQALIRCKDKGMKATTLSTLVLTDFSRFILCTPAPVSPFP